MKLLGLEIKRDRTESEWSMQQCYKCSKLLWVAKDNLRAYQYCNECL
jgi:hypothetical protein